ncbi:MAG: hypothetical protein CXT73_00975 [Methanobacteriota archaeon]|jgi:hypothetical protein|nr:MAG: hypothetical protein CXT73_00975 [Euryarchaeota archaeon]
MATYKPNSIYALTPMDSGKLGIWDAPEVVITGNETTTTISRHHRNRPDLLSHELYGTPQLWWIFKMINPDKLNDPVWDFVEGVEILTPNPTEVSAYLS